MAPLGSDDCISEGDDRSLVYIGEGMISVMVEDIKLYAFASKDSGGFAFFNIYIY